MKVIIAGSRSYGGTGILRDGLYSCPFRAQITEVITGDALGIDTLADNWARFNNIDRTIMPANWGGQGKSGGYKRNSRMADYGEALLAIPNSPAPVKGSGTWNMIKIAFERGYEHIHVYCPEDKTTLNREGLVRIFSEQSH